MSEFSALTTEEQKKIINELGALAVDMDLDVKIETYRELVGILMAK